MFIKLYRWLFRKKNSRRVSLINVKDYPKELYSSYWEIRVMGNFIDRFGWGVRIYDRKSSKLIKEKEGITRTRNGADKAAQKWVLKQMPKYRRTA